MGVGTRIKGAVMALAGKAQTDPRLYRAATLTARDRHTARRSIEPWTANLIEYMSGYVLLCARRNAEVAASVPLRLYTKTDKASKAARRARKGMYASRYANAEEVTDHPVLDLINNPSRDDSMGVNLWTKWFMAARPLGNAYMHPIVDGQGPTDLMWMEPHRCTPIPDETGQRLIEGYWYGRDGSSVEFFAPDEVLHYRYGWKVDDPYLGQGWIAEVFQQQGLWNAATAYMLALMENQATPTGAFVLPELIGEDAFEQAKAIIHQEYTGVLQAGKPIVMQGGQFIPVGHTPKDLEYLGLREKFEQDIAASAGIPESVLRMNDANLASAREGHPQWMTQTIEPMVGALCEFLTENVLPMYGEDRLFFDFEPLVEEDALMAAQRDSALVTSGIMTLNEARAERGLEELDGGDVLRVNGTSIDTLDQGPSDPFAGFRTMAKPLEAVQDGKCCEHGAEVSQKGWWSEYLSDA